jgi:hypothetical protein
MQQLFRGVFFGTCDITIADVPLLFESGKLSWLFAVTICVTVGDPSVQLHRLQKRNPELSEQECQARIDSQLSLETKQKLAESLEQLSEQVEQVREDLHGTLVWYWYVLAANVIVDWGVNFDYRLLQILYALATMRKTAHYEKPINRNNPCARKGCCRLVL